MARTAATGRTAATNRVAVQDMKASLAFNGTSSLVDLGKPAAMQALADQTFSAWVKTYGGKSAIYSNGYSSSTQGQGLILGSSVTPGLNGRLAWFQGSSVVLSTSPVNALELGRWVHITVTQAGNTANIYVNGVLNRTASLAQTVPDAAKNSYLGCESSGPISSLKGCISTARIWNRALTADEVLANMQDQPPRDGLIGEWLLNEGAGTTALDTSGNGNHGTITAGTYTADVPTKKRGLVGGNMVKNGDFEYAPPFTAATTGNGKLVDGTASGGSKIDPFFWSTVGFGSFSAQYDVDATRGNVMKVSTLGANAIGGVQSCPLLTGAFANPTPVLPSTSYTLTGYLRTVLNSGGGRGAFLRVQEFLGDGTSGLSNDTTYITTTTDWTKYTKTITTAATTRFINIKFYVWGQTSTADLIMDAWFDDIVLTPTTPTTRSAA